MQKTVVLSSLLLLFVAAAFSGCEQNREEAVEDAAEQAEDLADEAGDAAEEAADEMEDRVDDLSYAPSEREHEVAVALNRFESFVQRIDELDFHLAAIQRPGAVQVRDALITLREESIQLGEQLAALKAADSRSWGKVKKSVDMRFTTMSEEIEEVGNAMHGLVCALHHHDGQQEQQETLLAAAK